MPAARLGVLRVLVGGYALWYLLARYGLLVHVARGDERLFRPVGLAALHDAPISPATFEWLLCATIVLSVLFVAGLFHRIVGPLFAVALLWLLSYRNSWSMIFHSANLLVVHVLVLGITPAANAFSLDAWFRRRVPWLTWPRTSDAVDWRYGWPVRLIGTVTTVVYALAGLAKVLGPMGWRWVDGAALHGYIFRDAIRKELMGDGATALARQLGGPTAMLTALAVFTLIVELGAPLALMHKSAARVWAALVFGMHWGIWAIMGIAFPYQLSAVAFAAFFPVEKLVGARR